MSQLRDLNFQTEDDVIADVQRLREGYRKLGQWSLPQICYHVAVPMKAFAPPEPADLERTPEQEKRKSGFVDYVVAERKLKPEWMTAAGEWIPPQTAGDADVDAFLDALRTERDYPHPRLVMGPLGPVTIGEFRTVTLVHAAHHLRHLVPTGDAE